MVYAREYPPSDFLGDRHLDKYKKDDPSSAVDSIDIYKVAFDSPTWSPVYNSAHRMKDRHKPPREVDIKPSPSDLRDSFGAHGDWRENAKQRR